MMEPLFSGVNALLPALLEQQAVGELMALNEKTAQHGLALTQRDAKELVETRSLALRSYGRVEFGGGVIGRLAEKFCDSPYLHQRNFAPVLHDLIEAFYYFKGEALDQIGDDELIDLMKEFFDTRCHGSVELLLGRELEELARSKRYEEQEPETDEDEEAGRDETDDTQGEDFYGSWIFDEQ